MTGVEILAAKGLFTLYKLVKAKAITGKVLAQISNGLINTAVHQGVGAAVASALPTVVLVGGVALTASVIEKAAGFITSVKNNDGPGAVSSLGSLIDEVGSANPLLEGIVGNVAMKMDVSVKGLALASLNELKGEAVEWARRNKK
ncbi:MAG TPA: hypothetical protein VK168_20105 [Saprospiraceae bacterium]|nr:hypothetical protein [Saprospiraceae bacterium]